MRLFATILLLFATMNLHAASELRVAFLSSQVLNSSELGSIEITGVGKVLLTASKNGNQLVVYAQDPDGTVIGKAETVVGLKDTPIYVKTDGGLEKITIYWGSE